MDVIEAIAERHPITYWLKLVDRLIDQSFDSVLGGATVTRRQWQILTLLHGRSATYAEIDDAAAPYLVPHMPTVRPVVDDLIHRDWVARVGSDRVQLTALGTRVYDDLKAAIATSRKRISDGISDEDYRTSIDVLRRMATNLGWSEAADMGPV